MEDTIILKQHYCYMFMLDIKNQTTDDLLKYFEKYDICNWIGKIETGERTGKLHYQMAIWSEHKKLSGQITAMRKYWTTKLGRATCAIKSARKIVSLSSYSTKEEGKLITNLPQSCLDKLPKWVNKTAEKLLWQDKVKNYIESRDLANKGKVKFAVKVMEFHRKHNKRPNRANMQYLMWKYDKLDTQVLLRQWNLIPDHEYDQWLSEDSEVDEEEEIRNDSDEEQNITMSIKEMI